MSTAHSERHRFLFISSNRAWGGSEELWSATAATLAAAGHGVTVLKSGVDETQPRIARLRELSCRIHDLAKFPVFLPARLYARITAMANRIESLQQAVRLSFLLRLYRRTPHIAVISQGGNFDGWMLAALCSRRSIPYVLVVQKATEIYWPSDPLLPRVRQVYRSALKVFFVSEHNRRLTEEQIGFQIARSEIVRNPFLVPWDQAPEWPEESGGLRLACVGRNVSTRVRHRGLEFREQLEESGPGLAS